MMEEHIAHTFSSGVGHKFNIKSLLKMKTNYIIKSQRGDEIETYLSSNTKREILARFNRLMKVFSKDDSYMVENIREGYSKVTFFGTYGMLESEYWIERA